MTHRLLVEGPVACFRRPELVDDDLTYDAITPIAARRLFEAIYWTPAIWWHIERIEVLRPIRMSWQGEDHGITLGQGRRSLCLTDVGYVIEGRFEMTAQAEAFDNPARHAAMFKRRGKGQRFFRQPELGGPAWPATLRPVGNDEVFCSAYADMGSVDLGWMIFDRDQENRERLRFYRPTMVGGVIDLTNIDHQQLPT